MPSTSASVLLAASTFAAGTALGYWLHTRFPIPQHLCGKLGLTSIVSQWMSGSLDTPDTDTSSTGGTPRLTVAGHDGADSSAASRVPLKVLILVRVDAGMDRAQLCCHSGRVVLQLFKKLYKRRHPLLSPWDKGGAIVVPLGCNRCSRVDCLQLCVCTMWYQCGDMQ